MDAAVAESIWQQDAAQLQAWRQTMDAAVAESIWQQDAAQHRDAQHPIFMAGCNCNIDHFDANIVD
eukprot:13780301-Ditylum_brightwellii.AAC.1